LTGLNFSTDVRGYSTNFNFAALGCLRPVIVQDGKNFTVACRACRAAGATTGRPARRAAERQAAVARTAGLTELLAEARGLAERQGGVDLRWQLGDVAALAQLTADGAAIFDAAGALRRWA